eukprot:2798244-Amphidinium_carterae.1
MHEIGAQGWAAEADEQSGAPLATHTIEKTTPPLSLSMSTTEELLRYVTATESVVLLVADFGASLGLLSSKGPKGIASVADNELYLDSVRRSSSKLNNSELHTVQNSQIPQRMESQET